MTMTGPQKKFSPGDGVSPGSRHPDLRPRPFQPPSPCVGQGGSGPVPAGRTGRNVIRTHRPGPDGWGSGRGSGRGERLVGRTVAEHPARTPVQTLLHRADIRVTHPAEVRPLREMFAHRPVRVSVQAPLPGMAGTREEEVGRWRAGQGLVAGELPAVVRRERVHREDRVFPLPRMVASTPLHGLDSTSCALPLVVLCGRCRGFQGDRFWMMYDCKP